jgi:hypothetical protein
LDSAANLVNGDWHASNSIPPARAFAEREARVCRAEAQARGWDPLRVSRYRICRLCG